MLLVGRVVLAQQLGPPTVNAVKTSFLQRHLPCALLSQPADWIARDRGGFSAQHGYKLTCDYFQACHWRMFWLGMQVPVKKESTHS